MHEMVATLLRKEFWAVHLVVISLCCYLTAGIVAVLVDASLASVTLEQPEPTVTHNPRVPGVNAIGLTELAKLTGLRLPEAAAPSPDAWTTQEGELELIKSSLRVKLLGTLWASQARWSLASILDLSTNRAQTYWVGDKLNGAEIVGIERDRTIVLNNRRREYIDRETGAADKTDPVQHKSSATGIRVLSENEYEVPQREIEKMLANLTDVASQVRAVPVGRDDHVQGFRLLSIQPESIFRDLGFRNGDLIQKINGYELNSVEAALELFTKLRQVDRIFVEYERDNLKGHRAYTLK